MTHELAYGIQRALAALGKGIAVRLVDEAA